MPWRNWQCVWLGIWRLQVWAPLPVNHMIFKYNNAKRSIPTHPTFVNDAHCDLRLWPVTSEINRVHPTCTNKEKKKEIWPSPMTKPPIPTENSKTKGQHTQTPPKTSITQRLRTDLGRSVGVTSNPTGVVKPVYGIPTFPLTAKAV